MSTEQALIFLFIILTALVICIRELVSLVREKYLYRRAEREYKKMLAGITFCTLGLSICAIVVVIDIFIL